MGTWRKDLLFVCTSSVGVRIFQMDPFLMPPIPTVLLDSLKAVTDHAPSMVMCDASGSQRDSEVSCELWCPSRSIDLAQLWLTFHSAEADPNTIPREEGFLV